MEKILLFRRFISRGLSFTPYLKESDIPEDVDSLAKILSRAKNLYPGIGFKLDFIEVAQAFDFFGPRSRLDLSNLKKNLCNFDSINSDSIPLNLMETYSTVSSEPVPGMDLTSEKLPDLSQFEELSFEQLEEGKKYLALFPDGFNHVSHFDLFGNSKNKAAAVVQYSPSGIFFGRSRKRAFFPNKSLKDRVTYFDLSDEGLLKALDPLLTVRKTFFEVSEETLERIAGDSFEQEYKRLNPEEEENLWYCSKFH